MDNSQIDYILNASLKNTGTLYLGTYAADQVPARSPFYPCCLITNTDPSDLPGMHWVAIYYPNPNEIEFFDSCGNPPTAFNFTIRNTFVRYNPYEIQSLDSTSCGHYCIYFLYERSHKKSFLSIVTHLFSIKHKSDHVVTSFTHILFSCISKKFTLRDSKCWWRRK